MPADDPLFVQRGGSGDPVLLLLHGLGATGDVWHGLGELLVGRWPGSWVVPDLSGHGRSPRLARYTFGAMAAEVARVLEPGRAVVVLGHSLGGALGLTLASGWFGVTVSAVSGLGIKVRWTAEELVRAAELAARPDRWFETRDEAAQRSLRVAGLAGLLAPNSLVDAGLASEDAGWRLALDPAVFGIGAPDMAGLLAACRARVVLAAGENDPMSRPEELRRLTPEPVVLRGLGHNAHVEDPAALLPLLDLLAGGG